MMLVVLLPQVVLSLLVCSQLPTALRRERDTLISNDALKGFYTAAEIAAVLAALMGCLSPPWLHMQLTHYVAQLNNKEFTKHSASVFVHAGIQLSSSQVHVKNNQHQIRLKCKKEHCLSS